MNIEENKDKNVVDGSKHFKMTSSIGGEVEFSIDKENKTLCAYGFWCPNEGRKFLHQLEIFADEHELELTITNVINDALRKILKDNHYIEYYIRDEYIDDTMQYWKRKRKEER